MIEFLVLDNMHVTEILSDIIDISLLFTEARIILMPMVVKHTQLHLTQRDELHQCVDILGELLTILEDKAVVCSYA